MPKTRNKYIYPIDKDKVARIDYDGSPAHVAGLRYSVDFIVPEGTAVKAALDGVVIEVKSDSNKGGPTQDFEIYGNYIEIEHRNGEYSEYEQLKLRGSIVKVGNKVSKGQIIGYSGGTG